MVFELSLILRARAFTLRTACRPLGSDLQVLPIVPEILKKNCFQSYFTSAL